jgi:IS1 family transposase
MSIMNKLPIQKRAQILQMLAEGNNLRATSRMADVAYNTVLKMVSLAGQACAQYQDKVFQNLTCKKLQVDEIWAFVYSKAKNVPEGMEGQAGDVWTWVAIDADTKLVPAWMIGGRDGESAKMFISDLASRLANRVQLTSDGLKAYVEAVEDAFGTDIDFAQLVKIYGENVEGQKRYSPAECVGTRKEVIRGNPNPKHVSTSYVERQNLTIRMQSRRFTRLTNAFSKKVENHSHGVAFHFMNYNFARIHKSLRVTPAMAAGVTDHVWTFEEIAALMD